MRFSKSLNISYNISYNKTKEITFNPHVFDNKENRKLDLDKVEETIRTGKILKKKCRKNKQCFYRFFGKENKTYTVIVIKHKNFVEVITAWKKQGR